MGAGHGDDFGLLHQQVVDAVSGAAQQLKRPKFLQLLEDLAQMPEATLCMRVECTCISIGLHVHVVALYFKNFLTQPATQERRYIHVHVHVFK